MHIGGQTARELVLVVMRSHGVFDAGVGIVGVLHTNVAIAVAQLRARHGRGRCRRLRVQSALVRIEFEAGGRLGLLRLLSLAIAVVAGRHLIAAAAAITCISPRTAGACRVGVCLPLLHGCRR